MKRRLIKKYKKQKAFTLIELLAVILILGIIALIAIPTVSSVVEQSRKGAFENSVINVATTIETKCTMELLGTNGITKFYIFNNGEISPSVDIKGSLPKNGYVKVNDKCEVLIYAVDGNYTIAKPFDDEKIEVLNNKETAVKPPELAKYDKIEVYKAGNIIDELIIEGVSEDSLLFNFYNSSPFVKDTYAGSAIMYDENYIEDVVGYHIIYNASKYSAQEIEKISKEVEKVSRIDALNSCNDYVGEEKNICLESFNQYFDEFKMDYFIYNDVIYIQIDSAFDIDLISLELEDILNAFHGEMANNNAERILFFE